MPRNIRKPIIKDRSPISSENLLGVGDAWSSDFPEYPQIQKAYFALSRTGTYTTASLRET